MSNSNVSSLVSQFLAGASSTPEVSSGDPDDVVRADATPESEALEDYGTEAKSDDSTTEDLLPGSDDAQKADSKGKATAKADSKPTTSGEKEVITITDDKGRRQVEIDYGNKEAIKKAFQFQYGARKWQAERDKALETSKKVESELSQIKSDWSKLDEAFQQGPEKLIDTLMGQGSFQQIMQKHLEKQEFLKTASPREIEAYQAKEQAEAQRMESEKLRKEYDEFKKQITSEKETAEERALQSTINPVFDKYRFAEKLGNTEDETMFDQMLWTTALQRLEPYEEKGIPLTAELVDKEFRAVASSLRNRINVQAEKKATKVVEQKKREATENVQSKVVSGYTSGGAAKEARDLIQKGDLTSLIKGWGKYGSLFNKKN